MRLNIAGLALLAALGLGATAGAAQASPQDRASALQTLNDRLDGMINQIGENKGGCTPAQISGMQKAIDDPLFPQIETFMRAKSLSVALFCAINDSDPKHSDPEGAAKLARQLEPIAKQPEEVGIANLVLFFYGMDKDQFEGARFVKLMDVWPDGVAGMSHSELDRILQMAGKGDPKLADQVFDAVLKAPWEASDIQQAVNNDWALDYAYILADQKDMDGVRKALARMDDPTDLIQVAEDRRFEPLWAEFEDRGRFNWKIHSQVTLDAAVEAAASDPNSLAAATTLMKTFLREDRMAEAMPLGAMWRAKIKSKAAFDDKDDIDEFLDAYGAVLVNAGKLDDAAAVYEDGVTFGDDKAGHMLTWGLALLSDGQNAKSIQTLSKIDRKLLTPAGTMWIDAGTACANAKDHAADAKALLSKMQAQTADNPAAVQLVLLCLDMKDAAADLYAKRFANNDQRIEALEASRTGPAPKEATAWDKEIDKRKQAALADGKAARALTAVGRRVEAPVQLSSLGNF